MRWYEPFVIKYSSAQPTHHSHSFILAPWYMCCVSWFSMLTVISTHPVYGGVIKWKHFPRHWPFVRGIQRSPLNSPHKGQWRGALMLSLICACIKGCVNNSEAGDLRRHRAHYDVSVVMCKPKFFGTFDWWTPWWKCSWVFCFRCQARSKPLPEPMLN